MNLKARQKLEKAGFKVGGVQEFLQLSDDEMAVIDLKVRLIEKLKATRKAARIKQAELANLLASSQSRVAKIEAGEPEVSLDLICRALFAMGLSREQIGRAISARRAA